MGQYENALNMATKLLALLQSDSFQHSLLSYAQLCYLQTIILLLNNNLHENSHSEIETQFKYLIEIFRILDALLGSSLSSLVLLLKLATQALDLLYR